MSILDKAIAAVTPPESEEDGVRAGQKAESCVRPGDWLSHILDHHRQIEGQFAMLKAASTTEARDEELHKLRVLLTGHSIAEEAAIDPALAADRQVGHAELAYQEQSAAKMEMGLLERLDPMSEDYHDKLEHIEGAVLHHVYSEEGIWYPELAGSMDPAEQARVTARYDEEYQRYIGSAAHARRQFRARSGGDRYRRRSGAACDRHDTPARSAKAARSGGCTRCNNRCPRPVGPGA